MSICVSYSHSCFGRKTIVMATRLLKIKNKKRRRRRRNSGLIFHQIMHQMYPGDCWMIAAFNITIFLLQKHKNKQQRVQAIILYSVIFKSWWVSSNPNMQIIQTHLSHKVESSVKSSALGLEFLPDLHEYLLMPSQVVLEPSLGAPLL